MAIHKVKLLIHRHTAAEWAASSEILLAGQVGWSTDTHVLKIGDGVNLWSALPTANAGVTDHGALTGLADNDHPQYQYRVVLSAYVPSIPAYAPAVFWTIKQFNLSDVYPTKCRVNKIVVFFRGVCDQATTIQVKATGIGVADKTYTVPVLAMAAAGSLTVDEPLTIASHNVITVAGRMDAEPMEPPAEVSVDIITQYEP